jgi:hypothetical protein
VYRIGERRSTLICTRMSASSGEATDDVKQKIVEYEKRITDKLKPDLESSIAQRNELQQQVQD